MAASSDPDDDFESDFESHGDDDFGDDDDPVGFEPEDGEGTASTHSESVFVVDDEEAGRESFLQRVSAAFEQMAEKVAFADDVYVDADPTARDAASGLLPSMKSARLHDDDGEVAPEEPAIDPVAAEAARRHLRGLLEALLFVSERPLKAADLADVARADLKEVRSVLEALSEEYREEQRGIQLDELAAGFQIRTAAAYAPFVREITNAKPVRLSRAQVETLAIVAYRQPITRPEIEDIRGVDAGAVLKLLLDRDMVRILGKKDEPGRPLLYGTTIHFLGFFGLKSLKDLPTLREFTELTDESRETVERELGEVLPDGPREPVPSISPEHIQEDGPAKPTTEQRADTDEQAVVDAPSSERPIEVEAKPENDTGSDEPKPGGAAHDPADEALLPDDDSEDDDEEDEPNEDDDGGEEGS